MEKFDMLEEMLEYFEPIQLLEEVIRALDISEVTDILNYIKRMHEID